MSIGKKPILCVDTSALLSGCASVNFEQSLTNTNQEAYSFTQLGISSP